MHTFTLLALFACSVLAAAMAESASSETMPTPAMIGDLSKAEDAAQKSAALKKDASRSARARAPKPAPAKPKHKSADKHKTRKNSRKTRSVIDFFFGKKSSTTTTTATTTTTPVPAVPSIEKVSGLNETATVNGTETTVTTNSTATSSNEIVPKPLIEKATKLVALESLHHDNVTHMACGGKARTEAKTKAELIALDSVNGTTVSGAVVSP